jgi:deoxyribodipyrimidine photolyase-related protein
MLTDAVSLTRSDVPMVGSKSPSTSTRKQPTAVEASAVRHLVLVLGDQLDERSAAFDQFDPKADVVWMAEVVEEATHVWCHQLRLVSFFSAMRHFRDRLTAGGWTVDYHELQQTAAGPEESSFASRLRASVHRHRPQRLIVVQPGDFRVLNQLQQTARDVQIPLEVRGDRHFYVPLGSFSRWAEGRKRLVLEHFYQEQRKTQRLLVDAAGKPLGGQWNFDTENRGSFGKSGPTALPGVPRFTPDALTRDVQRLVAARFADHPGRSDEFDLPVRREDALELLDDFITHRLPWFGQYQDAMWSGTIELYHSRLSHALNLKLLNPREVVGAAVTAYEAGHASLPNVEGFVRQIVGWREYVRGIYWQFMPEYEQRNALQCADLEVPKAFWTGDTEMACVRDSMHLVLRKAYAHHIQRLMVLGLYAQLLGVHPLRFHRWHMAMYADAIDWVSLPNTLGMSQHGDGGLMATKPYCASGKYVQRMSNYCSACRFRPDQATGEQACPLTTLYWNFLDRHAERFARNPRMVMQVKNLNRLSSSDRTAIARQAEQHRDRATRP